jgi:starch-binding outer membrane protein, SusD/RagB family
MMTAPVLDPGTQAFGGNLWNERYANIRNADVLLHALNNLKTGMTDEEKDATRGFAKTMMALEFIRIASTRDEAPIAVVDVPVGSELAPLEGQVAQWNNVVRWLNEGKADLDRGGTAFPFPLGSGFTGFDAPVSFAKFNRALLARAEVYRQNWQAAKEAVDASFIDTAGAMDLGVYHSFGEGAGDLVNGLTNPNIFVNPSFVTDAETQGATVDARVALNVVLVTSRSMNGVTSDYKFKKYEEASSPISIIRNEELILLRAEANFHLNNLSAAADDINVVRTVSAGLNVRNDLTATNMLDELLKQRRYALVFEGGHRWIDARRYNRLDQIALEGAGFYIHTWMPVPKVEMDGR